ncbi:MAG: hypothetical protein ACLFU2_06655 [Opitutales bacterium]
MALTKTEKRRRAEALVRKLESNETLLARLEVVIELVEGGEPCSLDEIEAQLIVELRKLGNESLGTWAQRREQEVAEELAREHGPLHQREKKRSTSTPPSGGSKSSSASGEGPGAAT